MKTMMILGGAVLAGSLLAAEVPDEAAGRAAALFKAAGVDRGLCVHVGVTDGALTAALGGSEHFVVHGLADNDASVERSRRLIQSFNLYGRISVERGGLGRLPYADNLVNLLVVDAIPSAAVGMFALKESLRVMRPDGVACFGTSRGKVDVAALTAAGFKDVRVSGPWTIAVKPRPADLGEWTHVRQGPGRTNTGDDLAVGPPRQLRWIDGPRRSTFHQGAPLTAVSSGGRLFFIANEAMPFMDVPPRVQLVARDAFNGMVLWTQPLPGKFPGPGALIALGDRVYAALGADGSAVCLDAATGALLRSYEGTRPSEMMVADGRLLLVEGGSVRALDPSSGGVQWSAKVEGRENKLLKGGRRLFVLGDRSQGLTCLDLESGSVLWAKAEPEYKGKGFAGFIEGTVVLVGDGKLAGLSAETGQPMWTHSFRRSVRSHAPGVYFSDDLIWVCNKGENSAYGPGEWQGLDPVAGGVKRKFSAQFTDKCAPGVATRRYLISGRLDFFDARDGKMTASPAARGVCRFGSIAANGLIYTFPNDCICSPYVNGLMALSGAPDIPEQPGLEAGDRLLPGPGSAPGTKAAGKEAGKDEWAIYRQNLERGGSAAMDLAGALKGLWKAELGTGLTAPTIAEGRVYVATTDDHRVHALDVLDGKTLWSFDAGGRVDSPPTLYQGLAVFGCRDGRVYCLNAASGERVWSFRAAPGDRRIMAYGQLESAWPVVGSLPVIDGKVLVMAGRHTALDGGMRLYALDVSSGRVIWEEAPQDPGRRELMVRTGARVVAGEFSFDPVTGDGSKVNDRKITALTFGSSFDDPSYSVRTQWRLPGGATGQMLSFDGSRVLGFHGNREKDKYSITAAGKGQYTLFLNREKAKAWGVTLPIRPCAVLLAGDKAFVAGPPDAYPFQGGRVMWYAAADGKELGSLDLGGVPVHDGMAAAAGRLFVSTEDGKLHSFGKP